MAFRISNDLKNYLCNTGIVTSFAGTTGTAGTATLYIYAGTQPASANDGTAGTLSGTFGVLVCVINNIGWTQTTTGTCSLAATGGYSGTSVTSGTVGWGRLETVNSLGTCRVDGDVGTSGMSVFRINVSNISSSEVITLLSADVYMA